jgi:hypothetical protein
MMISIKKKKKKKKKKMNGSLKVQKVLGGGVKFEHNIGAYS